VLNYEEYGTGFQPSILDSLDIPRACALGWYISALSARRYSEILQFDHFKMQKLQGYAKGDGRKYSELILIPYILF
jgi:hypothetical protein